MGARPIIVGLYPTIPLWIAKFFQNLAAGTVAGVLFYFIFHLSNGGYTLPWMFYFLQGAALATIVTNLVIQILGCTKGTFPVVNTILSAILFVAWAVGFGLLVNAMRSTITRECSVKYWGNDQGVMVCNLYRTLFIGAGVGLLFTIFSLVLDILAWKKSSRIKRNGHAGTTIVAKGAGSQYMPVWSNDGSGYQGQQNYPIQGTYSPQPGYTAQGTFPAQGTYPAQGNHGHGVYPAPSVYQENVPYDPQVAYQGQTAGVRTG